MSLENFRKQAKLLVRWHREGNYSVGGRIRKLPRYGKLSDRQALALAFPLNEAQEIIALEQGFASWAELLHEFEKSPARERTSQAIRLKKGIPVVLVTDVKRAAEFYRDMLGFAVDFLHGEPSFYASVSRDEASIHLRLVHEPRPPMEEEQVIAAFLAVENVKGLFAEFKARKAPFVHRLRKEPWGQSAFIVRDPDGNGICFAG